MIEMCDLEPERRKKLSPQKNKIVFVLEGDLKMRYNDLPEKKAKRGDFFFIPSSGQFDLIPTRRCVVLLMRLPGGGILCGSYNVEQLYKDRAAMAGKEAYDGPDISMLKANRPLWNFLHGLNESMKGGLNCQCYFENKIRELLIVLKASYPLKELQALFYPVLSPDMAFLEYVRANRDKYNSVAEFAQAIGMTPKNFAVVFVKVFNETPQRWLAKEKAKRVYAELHSGKKPLKQIADELGFSSQQHFNKFCQRELGKTPKKIRDREYV